MSTQQEQPGGPPERIAVGAKLWARDAYGDWLEMVAMSPIEPAGRTETSHHDFAGVYVCRPGFDGEGVFWPLDALRDRSSA